MGNIEFDENSKEIQKELVEKLVTVNRIAKVVKGGRRFSFNALVVIGDKSGRVSIGMGKANEIPDAIRKGMDKARRDLVKIHLANGNRIPHEVVGRFKCSKVMLKPASPGTGIIAGEAVRSVIEQVGIHDVLCKVIGSKNKFNVVKATMDALKQLQTIAEVIQKRKLHLSDILIPKKVEELNSENRIEENQVNEEPIEPIEINELETNKLSTKEIFSDDSSKDSIESQEEVTKEVTEEIIKDSTT